jgi:tRNA (uracil-5-)-methyltransferase TRM9
MGHDQRQLRDDDDELPPASIAQSATATADATSAVGAQVDVAAQAYELEHVHGVYEAIASHFSATRHKPWPVVADFLRAQAAGSIGLDVGCGNGKYLAVNDHVLLLGCDRSEALVALARRHRGQGSDAAVGDPSRPGTEVMTADVLALPFRDAAADFVISVAVIHHLSTRDRRQDAIRQLLRCLRRPDSQVLIFVWALEQASSRRGWDEGGDQDLLVPWVIKANQPTARKLNKAADADTAPEPEPKVGPADQTFQRYYHLYRKGELDEDVVAAGGQVLSSGYDRDNWWVIATRRT